MRVLTCVILCNPDPTRKVLIRTLRNAILQLEKLRASVRSHPSISFHFPLTLVTMKISDGVDAPPEGLGAARFSPICWEPEPLASLLIPLTGWSLPPAVYRNFIYKAIPQSETTSPRLPFKPLGHKTSSYQWCRSLPSVRELRDSWRRSDS